MNLEIQNILLRSFLCNHMCKIEKIGKDDNVLGLAKLESDLGQVLFLKTQNLE